MNDSAYQNFGNNQSQGDQADLAKARLVEDWVHSHSGYLHAQNGHLYEDTINQALKTATGEDRQVLSFLSEHYQDLVKLQGDTPNGSRGQLTVAGLANLELVDSNTLKAQEDAHPADHGGFWHKAIDVVGGIAGGAAAGALTWNPWAAAGGAAAGAAAAEGIQDYLEGRSARQPFEQRAESARNLLKDLNQ